MMIYSEKKRKHSEEEVEKRGNREIVHWNWMKNINFEKRVWEKKLENIYPCIKDELHGTETVERTINELGDEGADTGVY